MFILMHLSPHSWYKIRKSKAQKKKKRSGVLASEGHHIYIYSWWPIQVIARQSLETENSLDPAEPWKLRAPGGLEIILMLQPQEECGSTKGFVYYLFIIVIIAA